MLGHETMGDGSWKLGKSHTRDSRSIGDRVVVAVQTSPAADSLFLQESKLIFGVRSFSTCNADAAIQGMMVRFSLRASAFAHGWAADAGGTAVQFTWRAALRLISGSGS